MGVPATTGQLRTNITDMEIGDYIKLGYNQGTSTTPCGHFYKWNYTGGASEVPINGFSGGDNGGGYFYLVKVKKGLLISDRVVRNSISWDILNQTRLIQGTLEEHVWRANVEDTDPMSGLNGIFRSLTGGVAYADANGNLSTTDQGYGAFPTNNEWDRYIVNFPSELIQEGKTLDDVFHYTGVLTLTQDTPINDITSAYSNRVGSASSRVQRGHGQANTIDWLGSSTAGTIYGFRPAFQYKEV